MYVRTRDDGFGPTPFFGTNDRTRSLPLELGNYIGEPKARSVVRSFELRPLSQEWPGERRWGRLGEAPATGGQHAAFVRWIQLSLNRVVGAGLVVDGIMGPKTRTAVKSFQLQAGIKPDGVVGPVTRGLLLARTLAPSGTVPRGFRCTNSEVIAPFVKAQSFIEPGEKPKYLRFVERIAQCVSETQGTPAQIEVVEIEGHASSEGTKTANFNYGAVRALRVATDLAAALVAKGHSVEVNPVTHRPPAIALVTRTRGASRPRASNNTEAGRRANRRVEVLLPVVMSTVPCPAPRTGPFVTILLELIKNIGGGIPAWFAVKNGGRLPTTVRQLCDDEIKEAYKVFGGSLDFTKILISDGVGAYKGKTRPLTTAVEHPDGWHVVLNLGDIANWTTSPGRRCKLIHELVHAWQSQHHGTDKQAYMWTSLKSQIGASAALSYRGEYAYVPGDVFEKYAAEQIAQQVQDDYMRTLAAPKIMSVIRPPKPNERVPENEESVARVAFLRKSAKGVQWPTLCPK